MSEKPMGRPTRILFVCHGNICRSTMAQCVMQYLVDEAGRTDEFTIDSAATTNEEIGMPIYPPARDKLKAEGVPIVPHCARRVIAGEQDGWDYIVVMDDENVRHLRRILGPENMGKVRKLMSYVGEERDVADPWYTRNFDECYDDVLTGCQALLAQRVPKYTTPRHHVTPHRHTCFVEGRCVRLRSMRDAYRISLRRLTSMR